MTTLNIADALSLRVAIHVAFIQMNMFQREAEACVRPAMAAMRDLAIKAELIAEAGVARFPRSKYNFEKLRGHARADAELWQEYLAEETSQ
jgi:hypothetical protein